MKKKVLLLGIFALVSSIALNAQAYDSMVLGELFTNTS